MFSSNEQKAILKLVDRVIKADNYIDLSEVDYLEAIIEEFSFDSKNLRDLHKISEKNAVEVLKEMETEKKHTVIKVLSAVSESDNDINIKESNLLSRIRNLLMN